MNGAQRGRQNLNAQEWATSGTNCLENVRITRGYMNTDYLMVLTFIYRHVLLRSRVNMPRRERRLQYGPAYEKHLIRANLRFLLGHHVQTT